MKLFKYILFLFISLSILGCSEDLLVEEPLDFLSPNNSFRTPEDIEATLFSNYQDVRELHAGKINLTMYLHYGTDIGYNQGNFQAFLGNYETSLVPTTGVVSTFWNKLYEITATCNVVLNRIEQIEYSSAEEKNLHIAEARFFRGYAYRFLVHLYGGVPIVEEEISSPRRDFVRASKAETLAFAIADLEFAAANLPGIDDLVAEGRVNNAAALHFLAELYIANGEPTKAVTATTTVIESSGLALMTNRFGAKADEDGDPYWDLFQQGNQNRSAGNTEGIYVIQSETNVQGGAQIGVRDQGDVIAYERGYGPGYWIISGPDDVRITFPSTQQGGRPVAFIRPTFYLTSTIWGGADNTIDVRNNERNIKREYDIDNPASAFFGQTTRDLPQEWRDNFSARDTLILYYPYFTKATTINDHPDFLILDKDTGLVSSDAGITYKDWYLLRLAETYLLRAEARLTDGDASGAADDINAVRNRSGATPATVGEINIDYILDERLRELNYEEPRRLTLNRLGLLDERTRLANPISGASVQDFNNLFPIPFSEIERNTLQVLEQNPGYTN